LYSHWHALPDGSGRQFEQEFQAMTVKSTLLAAIAALMVSAVTVGAAIAPAQAVNLPVRTVAGA
jgi:uncharacterized membrane protein